MKMTERDRVVSTIQDRLRDRFPEYPVDVRTSPDDEHLLCVRVFAVPDDAVESVEDLIFDLQEEILDSAEFILLPMVKDLATTHQYYPQHAPLRVAEDGGRRPN